MIAGLYGPSATTAVLPSEADDRQSVLVLWASQTGNADHASDYAERLRTAGFTVGAHRHGRLRPRPTALGQDCVAG